MTSEVTHDNRDESKRDTQRPGSCSRPRKVLIIGCGYLGLRAAERWLSCGTQVFAVTRSQEKAAQLRTIGVVPIVGDITDETFEHHLPLVDLVLWAVGFERNGPASRRQVWIDALASLTRQLPRSPQRFVYVSSTSVYGDAGGDRVDEDSQTAPTTEGGTTCLEAECLLREELAQCHPTTACQILRLAGIYGPDRLLRRVSELQAGRPISGAPDQWLNLIHVDDAAALITDTGLNAGHAASDPAPLAGPALINVVNRDVITRRQYYSLLAELTGAPGPIFAGPATTPPTAVPQPGGRIRTDANRRVVSKHSQLLSSVFRFDDLRDGLYHAVSHSRTETSGSD